MSNFALGIDDAAGIGFASSSPDEIGNVCCASVTGNKSANNY